LAQYGYDPNGLRHSKEKVGGGAPGVVTHLWDGQEIAAELSGSGTVSAVYSRGNGELICQQIGENRSYYLHNAHGDVTERIDENGTLLKRHRYDSFGNILNPAALGDPGEPIYVDQNPFGYCGEYLDRETQEIYLRARYYDSATGRFNCEDPERIQTRKIDYTSEKEVIDGLALNPYVYGN